MTMRLPKVLGLVVGGAVTLGAVIAATYAAMFLLFAVVVARGESMWQRIHVYEYGASALSDSREVLLDIYAQAPRNALGWMGLSAFVVAAWATVVWGTWLVAWMAAHVGTLDPSRKASLRPTRIAAPVFLWGVVVLSLYALAIFLWNWFEWKHLLEAGLTLPGDPKPEPNPAFDPWQIPLGIVAFVAIAAIAIVMARVLARRRRAQGTPPTPEA